MILRAAKRAAILILIAAGALRAAPAWQVPGATVRLRALSSSHFPHLARIDLPEALRGETKEVRAMLPGGRALGARLIRMGDVPVAVEVAVPTLRSASTKNTATDSAAPIEVYLLNGSLKTPPALDTAQRTPALLHRSVRSTRSLTTRPFTPEEAIRLVGAAPVLRRKRSSLRNRARTYFYWAWDAVGIGQTLQRSRWADPGERKVAVIHWATDLRIENPRAVAFGANQRNVAWFVYVDGKPVADWHNSSGTPPNPYTGPVVELATGFHLLEYIVVQQHDEPIPQIFWRDRGSKEASPVPTELQHSVRLPTTVLVERQNGEAGGFTFARAEQRLRAYGQDQFLDALLGAPKVSGKVLDAAQWASKSSGDREVFVPIPALPPIRVPFGKETLLFPSRHVWLPPTTFEVDVRIQEAQAVLSSGQPFEAKVDLDRLDHISSEIASRLRLHWLLRDAKGSTLRSGEVVCKADRKGAETALSIAIEATARSLELRVMLDGHEVARRRTLRILRPADSLVGLRAVGRSLFVDRERALLVCNPLAALRPLPPTGRKGTPHLVILDDFWATVSGPEADVRPETVLGEQLPYAVSRLAVPRGRAAGAAGDLRKFGLLPALAERRADATLFALGWEDLQVGASARDLCRHLLFLVQAAHAHGTRPYLMALPSLPDAAPATTREAALLVKGLGFQLGVPVVDAFSAERRGTFDSGLFSQYFTAAQGAVTLSTPNNAGRQRLCELVRQVLRP
ncbi:MAG: hypothetical protein HN380_10345 [Victivallales bacterium]|nr:hypothetical protein [Victivallales bacterium]